MDLTRAAEPWVAYAALVDLADVDPSAPEARSAYDRLAAHPLIGALVDALDPWPAAPLTGAYDPKDTLWQLSMLADFGLRRDDPRIAAVAERIFAAQAEDGGFLHGGFAHTRTWGHATVHLHRPRPDVCPCALRVRRRPAAGARLYAHHRAPSDSTVASTSRT